MTILEVIAFKLREKLHTKLQLEGEALIEEIDAILPQTQCRKCHYPGCKPYAEAIVSGDADINQCPPGGEQGIRTLATLLGREFKPLSSLHGVESPKTVAIIDEEICIGCTLCIQACPVDAIVGAAKQMHTIIADHCTGCELCLPPCPVDCIRMEPNASHIEKQETKYPAIPLLDYYYQAKNELSQHGKRKQAANAARERYKFHQFREARDAVEKSNKLAVRSSAARDHVKHDLEETNTPTGVPEAASKKALIAAAIARARMQQSVSSPKNTTQLAPEQQAEIAAIEAHREASMKPSGSHPPEDTL